MQAMITLESDDGKEIKVSKQTLAEFETLKLMMEDIDVEDDTTKIPISNTDGATLQKMIEWAEHHRENKKSADFYERFFNMPMDDLKKLVLSSDYLNQKELFDATCKRIAVLLESYSFDEIRDTLGSDLGRSREQSG